MKDCIYSKEATEFIKKCSNHEELQPGERETLIKEYLESIRAVNVRLVVRVQHKKRGYRIMDEFDYYFNDEDFGFVITRNKEVFLWCCGTEAETQHIVELLRKDAERENGQMQSLRSSACLDTDGGRREMDAMQ